MKRILNILLILCSVAFFGAAQTTHTPGVWVQGGYAGLVLPKAGAEAQPKVSALHGGGGGLGVDYTLQAGHFVMNIGVGGSLSIEGAGLEAEQHRLPGSVDLDGMTFAYVYDIQSRRDQYTAVQLEVPVLFGGAFGRFRFLLGGKLLYGGLLRYKTTLEYSTWGDYPQFLDPFVNMPEHQFYPGVGAEKSERVGVFQPDVCASMELGWRLTPEYSAQKAMVHLSVYADLGLLNHYAVQKTGPAIRYPELFTPVKNPLEEGDPMLTGLDVTHLLASDAVAEGLNRHLAVGLKLHVGFPLQGAKKSPWKCHCIDF